MYLQSVSFKFVCTLAWVTVSYALISSPTFIRSIYVFFFEMKTVGSISSLKRNNRPYISPVREGRDRSREIRGLSG